MVFSLIRDFPCKSCVACFLFVCVTIYLWLTSECKVYHNGLIFKLTWAIIRRNRRAMVACHTRLKDCVFNIMQLVTSTLKDCVFDTI